MLYELNRFSHRYFTGVMMQFLSLDFQIPFHMQNSRIFHIFRSHIGRGKKWSRKFLSCSKLRSSFQIFSSGSRSEAVS